MMAQMVKITNCSCSLRSIECSESIVLVFVSNLSFYFLFFFDVSQLVSLVCVVIALYLETSLKNYRRVIWSGEYRR